MLQLCNLSIKMAQEQHARHLLLRIRLGCGIITNDDREALKAIDKEYIALWCVDEVSKKLGLAIERSALHCHVGSYTEILQTRR